MATYYWVYSLLTFFAVIIYARKKPLEEKNKKACIIGFLSIFLLLALRHPYMGVDLGWEYSNGYLKAFEVIGEYRLVDIFRVNQYLNYEKGYIIFNKLVSLIFKNEQFFMAMSAFAGLMPIAFYTYKRSKSPLLSVFIFVGLPVFLIFFSGLRQSIAIGITVVSMFFVEKRKMVLFVLTVLLATLFHSSAIIFLLAYPLYHMKLNNIGRLGLFTLIPIVFALKKPLFRVFSRLFKENARIQETGALTLFLVFVLIYVFLIVFNDTSEKKNIEAKQQNGLINLCYMACICQAFGGLYNTASRVGYYFMTYMIIAIPNTLENFRHIKVKYNSYYTIVKLVIGLVFVIYGLYALSHSTWARTNPYIFFWQG